MATAQRIYLADVTGAPNSPDGGGNYMWADRRAFGYTNYTSGGYNKNLNSTFYRLSDGTSYDVGTNRDDSVSWHTVRDMEKIWKTGLGSEYGFVSWDVKTIYRNLIGYGPFFSHTSRSFFHPNVTGVTFSFIRDGANVDGECGFKKFGSLYYQPSSNRWRSLEWSNHSHLNLSGYANRVYESPSGDRFTWYGTDPTNFFTTNKNWHSVKAWAGATAENYILNEEWLWGGFYIQVECTDAGGISRIRQIKLADLQPIYKSPRSDAKLVLPFGSLDINDLRTGGRRLIR